MKKYDFLGKMVEDKVTGLTGIVENAVEFLYGVTRYGVQPLIDKAGKVPDSAMIDECQLTELSGYGDGLKVLPAPKILLKLGSVVHDPIRDMSGIVTGRAVYLNGCARVLIEPKQIAGKDFREAWWVDEPQPTLVKVVKEQQEKKTLKSRITGGPARSSSMR